MARIPTVEEDNHVNWVYWRLIRDMAKRHNSDGCTMATEAFQPCCFEHDIHCRTGYQWKVHVEEGQEPVLTPVRRISRREADARFRQCIAYWGPYGNWFEKNLNFPWRWLRWTGVRTGAAWDWMKFWK